MLTRTKYIHQLGFAFSSKLCVTHFTLLFGRFSFSPSSSSFFFISNLFCLLPCSRSLNKRNRKKRTCSEYSQPFETSSKLFQLTTSCSCLYVRKVRDLLRLPANKKCFDCPTKVKWDLISWQLHRIANIYRLM